jgi:hypothetical protein
VILLVQTCWLKICILYSLEFLVLETTEVVCIISWTLKETLIHQKKDCKSNTFISKLQNNYAAIIVWKSGASIFDVLWWLLPAFRCNLRKSGLPQSGLFMAFGEFKKQCSKKNNLFSLIQSYKKSLAFLPAITQTLSCDSNL